jgi:hypothetical protein
VKDAFHVTESAAKDDLSVSVAQLIGFATQDRVQLLGLSKLMAELSKFLFELYVEVFLCIVVVADHPLLLRCIGAAEDA